MIIEAAMKTSTTGLQFLRPEDVPEDHTAYCQMRVTFGGTYYPPEPDVGVGVTADGDIASIEIKPWGTHSILCDRDKHHRYNAVWRHLDGEAFQNAKRFLRWWHADEVADAIEAAATDAYEERAA